MYYANPGPIRYVHPSGIPVPMHVPVSMPQPHLNEVSDMTTKDGLELAIGLPPPPPQATGSTDLTAHGTIHVK